MAKGKGTPPSKGSESIHSVNNMAGSRNEAALSANETAQESKPGAAGDGIVGGDESAGHGPGSGNQAAPSSRPSGPSGSWAHKMFPTGFDILIMVGLILAGSLVTVGIMMIISLFWKNIDEGLFNCMTYGMQFLLAIIFIVVYQNYRGQHKNFINLNPGKINLPMVLWGVILVFISGVVIEPLLELMPNRYLDLMDGAIGSGGWAILTTVILAPVLEETLFRGLILGSIREKSGAFVAVLLSAAIFGIIHFIPQQVVNAFVVGIILGYIYVKTNSLIAVMLIHAVNNGLAFLLKELFGSTAATMTTRQLIANDIIYYIVYGICVVIFIAALVMMIRAMRRFPDGVSPETTVTVPPQHTLQAAESDPEAEQTNSGGE